ncbi:MAG: hypothetical protein IRZ03_10970 [Acidobacterium ailaaui]|nr:hypothetical protein [Pseudacidobacterium ailaaui]
MKKIIIFTILSHFFLTIAYSQTISININDTGRAFEGVGMLSAGASSRFLIDYPEPYRSDILDLLFKPKFGANIWQLKVENGGDINSTDGAELSYAHTKKEFLRPKAAYFNRGYEWWLIKEAKKRNPNIQIEILQWGAPGWIDSFYSQTNAKYIAKYIKGLKKYHDITIDYTGIHNETMYNISWIKLLRETLNNAGLSQVKIDVGDQWKPEDQWKIANDIANDSALAKAVYAINCHVPELTHFYTPAVAQQIHKPIWSGESHAIGGDWYAAAMAAKINNRSYPEAKITKVIYWSLITSYPDYLTAPSSGIMKANMPWSGHYEIQPPLWIVAHINQFAKPGWKYINDGCKFYKREGWSVITLKDTATDYYSIIIETMSAKEPHTIHFKLKGDFSDRPLAVWESSFKKFLFKRRSNLTTKNGTFSIRVEPNSIYSLTTTRGQKKGKPENSIPPLRPFPSSYQDNFDQDRLNQEPPYFLNYHGAFEVVKDKHSQNHYLKQSALKQGINWFTQPYPSILFGDSSWKDVKVSVDFLLPDTGVVKIQTRLHDFEWNSKIKGYSLEIDHNGSWKLKLANTKTILAQGEYRSLKNDWHQLQFNCIGNQLEVFIDQQRIAQVKDNNYKSGVIALATGWNIAYFDNFKIEVL